MLISESRFRKIINEELKKMMKEAGSPAQTQTSQPAQRQSKKGTAYTQAKIDETTKKSIDYVEKAVGSWVSFLTKKGKNTNAAVLKDKWSKIKSNQYPDKETLSNWSRPTGNVGMGMGLMGYLTGVVDPNHLQDFQKTFGVPFSEEAVADNLGIKTSQDVTEVNKFYFPKDFATSLYNIINLQMGAQLNVKQQPHPDEKGGMAPRNATPGTQPIVTAKPAALVQAVMQTTPYTIKQGDTITKILQRYYGFDPRLWNALQQVEIQSITNMFGTNNPNVIVPRKTVNLLPSIVLGGKTYQLKQPAPPQPQVVPIGKQPISGRE